MEAVPMRQITLPSVGFKRFSIHPSIDQEIGCALSRRCPDPQAGAVRNGTRSLNHEGVFSLCLS
jgi:hypothetical protein